MATKLFSLYRYQIILSQKQCNLLYDINELLKRKNVYFEEAVLSLKISENPGAKRKYKYDIIRKGDNKMLLVIAREKSVNFFREDYVKDSIPSFPPVYLIIDNDREHQIIAVENSSEYANTNTILKELEKNLQRTLSKYNLLVKFSPIYKENSFWDYIEKNKDDISRLHFTLITPNMSNISGRLCGDLKEIAKHTRAATSDYKISADKDATLQIDRGNEAIAGLVDYTAQGGGTVSVRRKGSKICFKSNDYQVDIEIEDLELNEDIKNLIELIREKINGSDR